MTTGPQQLKCLDCSTLTWCDPHEVGTPQQRCPSHYITYMNRKAGRT